MQSLLENNGNLPADKTDGRLRCEVIDALMPGLSHAEQARRCGISGAHYSRIRRGQRGASVEIALRMARAAETTVEKLFGRAA